MKQKLKRIGYLILILIAIFFIFDNDEIWSVKILFLGSYKMPAWSMILLILGLGFLLGWLTPIWLRKRRESRATTL